MCSHQLSEFSMRSKADQLADAVHVSLDDVTAEAAIGLHGKFQVDQSTFMNARERSANPGFRGKIGTEGIGLDIERGEADSADCDAVARCPVLSAHASPLMVMRRFSPRCSMRVMRPTSSTMPVNTRDLPGNEHYKLRA